MISITRLREFLAETKQEIDGINFAELVIDDSQFVSFLKERKETDNSMLFGVVPQYPLDGREDTYQWINQLQFFILVKRSNRDSHDALMDNMETTRALTQEFVEYVILNSVGDSNLFCGLSNELLAGSLLVHPVWNKAQCDGWAIEFDLRTS
jgi:hypothetical protein